MQSNEYVKLAEVEDHMWYFRALHAHVHRSMRQQLSADAEVQVLDAGCGTGGLIERLRRWEPGWRFTGIDFSPLACEFAAQRCAVPIKQASITELPFPDRSFDAIVSADVICQVPDASVALREFHRCLRPGGIVIINVPAFMWMWSYHDEVCQTKHRFERRELVSLLRSAGFRVPASTYWNTILFPLLILRRKVFARRRATSDVENYSAPVEVVGRAAMALERAWLRCLPLPIGSSVFACGIAEASRPSGR